MKTRKLKKIKTRKMKGGYIVYENGSWKPHPTTRKGHPVSDIVMSYSISEASFFNKLDVPELNTREWLSDPANGITELRRIAPDLDAPREVFQEGVSRMKSAIDSLNNAYQKRNDNDTRISSMSDAERVLMDITPEDQQRHQERTYHMAQLLKQIKIFMKQYEDKEKSFRSKPTTESPRPTNIFMSFLTEKRRVHESPNEPIGRDLRAEEPEIPRPDRSVKSKGKKSKGKEKKKGSNYQVSTFNYDDFQHPTSILFTVNTMFIFSDNLLTILSDGVYKNTIECSDVNFCALKDNVITFTHKDILYEIELNEDEEEYSD